MLDFFVDASRCVQCGECAADCPVSVIDLTQGLPRILPHKEGYCIGCQHCLAVCPTAALSIFGIDPDTVELCAPPAPDVIENQLRGRRSVRRFRSEPVDGAILERLLRVTAHAPTGKNQRSVYLSLIDDPGVMQAVREKTIMGIRQAAVSGTLPEGLEFYAKFVNLYDQGQDIIFRDAPHMLVVSAPAASPAPEADPFITMTYFEIMASALGLGAVWCGFAAWAFDRVVPKLRDMLGVPPDHRSLYAMMFGYPAVRYARVTKRDIRNVRRVTMADLDFAR